MHPTSFTLHQPDTLEEALALKEHHGDDACYFSGGTELLIALKARVLHYDHVIDIKSIPELHQLQIDNDRSMLSIGARCTHRELARAPLVSQYFPGYAALSEQVANIRVRVAGSLGGVLCFGEPHADAPTLLCALDAQVVLASNQGRRRVPSREFHLGEFETAREENELMVAIELPLPAEDTHSAYRCFRQTERPAVGVAAVWSTSGAQRLSLWAGALSSAPIRMNRTEEAAQALDSGCAPESVWPALESAVRADAECIDTYDDLHGSADYKRHLVTTLAQRAIEASLP